MKEIQFINGFYSEGFCILSKKSLFRVDTCSTRQHASADFNSCSNGSLIRGCIFSLGKGLTTAGLGLLISEPNTHASSVAIHRLLPTQQHLPVLPRHAGWAVLVLCMVSASWVPFRKSLPPPDLFLVLTSFCIPRHNYAIVIIPCSTNVLNSLPLTKAGTREVIFII